MKKRGDEIETVKKLGGGSVIHDWGAASNDIRLIGAYNDWA